MELFDGHIRIEEMIGSGGFGDVYRGYDIRMEREVAVKRTYAMGKHEAQILKDLEHKGLPQIYDVYEKGVDTFIVMEWIEGINLDKYIEENGAFSESRSVTIGEEILDILDYLHSHSPAIIYQDLKPSNIILKPDGHIKLVDFGTAFLKKYEGEKILTAGTIGYGAPEQRGLLGQRFANERSDIYAWGAVMYSLISGILLTKPPYTMENVRRVCPNISVGFASVIKRATARENEKRFDNVEQVRRAIDNSVIINFLMKMLFISLGIATVTPFILAWNYASQNGLFAYVSGRLDVFISLWKMEKGLGLVKRILIVLKAVKQNGFDLITGMNDLLYKCFGFLLVGLGGMIIGTRIICKRKYIRIYRSVFLTDKKYPGLWISALLAGVILGTGLGCSFTSNAATKVDNILPVNLYDDYGNKMLVRYDKAIPVRGDLALNIDGDVFNNPGKKQLTLILDNIDSDEQFARTFFVQ